MTELLCLLSEACVSAGGTLMGHYSSGRDGVSSQLKDESDPRTIVTTADLESEEAILSILQPRLDCSFLSEERGESSVDGHGKYRIIVDPLDGSKNFAQNSFGLFGISVGVEESGYLHAGAIYLPYFHELLVGELGGGVYFGVPDGAGCAQMRGHALGMSRRPDLQLNRARISIARGSAPSSILSRPPMVTLLSACNEAINYASCSVGLAGVVLSRIDALVLPCQKYWDIAAGLAILRELALPMGIWRNEWRDEVKQTELTRAGASDCFDIVAAGNSALFAQIVSILQTR